MKNNKSKKAPSISTPGLVTMQWLTYVFWALTSIAIVYLVAVITQFAVGLDADSSTESIAYAVAAAFILLPIAFVLDIFFSRHEDDNKESATSVVRVVHSVLFAIISIVALVVAVFNLINMLLNSFSDKGLWIAVAAALATFLGFGILFIRTVKPTLFRGLRITYRYLVLAVVILASVVALTGPFARALETRQSRAVRDTLNYMTNAMSGYVMNTNSLPKNASELINSQYYYSGSDVAQANDLIAKNLITLRPNIKQAETVNEVTTYYYELCGTFDKDLKDDTGYVYTMVYTEYPTYIYHGDITAGTHCYKLSTTSSALKAL